MYILGEDTDALYLWDAATERWFFTNQANYPWLYLFGPGDGWLFFLEDGSSGSRTFIRNSGGRVLSEEDLLLTP